MDTTLTEENYLKAVASNNNSSKVLETKASSVSDMLMQLNQENFIHYIKIKSEKLTERLDIFFGHPTFDPHGGSILDKDLNIPNNSSLTLNNVDLNKTLKIVAVEDPSSDFSQYLDRKNLNIGTKIITKKRIPLLKILQLK